MKTIYRFIDCIKTNVEFVVGGNAQENHDIIDAADTNDLWFHVSGRSSCHVIAKINGLDKLDKKAIHKIVVQGALLCKENSALKSQKNVSIDYTKIEYVTKLDTPGSVTLTEFKTITI
jgi:predicted ribosome quality control (RQC) complex YloA/Tae2 family protein